MSIQTYLEEGKLTHKTWRRALKDGILLGEKCADCSHVTTAPKAACVRCGSRESETIELPTKGVVHTATTVRVAPVPFDGDDPYDVALVNVGESRVMAQTSQSVEIGDTVELKGVVEHEKGIGPLFSPIED